MKILFGESVRRLRLEKSLTQEALAAQLHVSFQTISKWERGETYPDLTMLPVLAQFFGVRTDDLLGVDQAENERRVQEILEAYDHNESDSPQEHLPKLKEAVIEFPLDFRLWVRYMECRLRCAKGLDGGREVHNEIRSIYENIHLHCTNDSIRMKAKRLFCMHLHSLAQEDDMAYQEEAEQILSQMPEMRACREHLGIMVSLEQEKACQTAISELMWMLHHAVWHYAKLLPEEDGKRLMQATKTYETSVQSHPSAVPA